MFCLHENKKNRKYTYIYTGKCSVYMKIRIENTHTLTLGNVLFTGNNKDKETTHTLTLDLFTEKFNCVLFMTMATI